MTPSKKANKTRLHIDFLYIDLNVCTRCQGTEDSLEEALISDATGMEVELRSILIENEEERSNIN